MYERAFVYVWGATWSDLGVNHKEGKVLVAWPAHPIRLASTATSTLSRVVNGFFLYIQYV